jgi:hypothetical protein
MEALTLNIQETVELTLSDSDSISSCFRSFFYKKDLPDGLYIFRIKFVSFSMLKKSSVYTDYLLSKEGPRFMFLIFPKEANKEERGD